MKRDLLSGSFDVPPGRHEVTVLLTAEGEAPLETTSRNLIFEEGEKSTLEADVATFFKERKLNLYWK